MTTVISIRQTPKGWENNKDYVYIGRAGKGMSGYFGNPIIVGKQCKQCGEMHMTGSSTLACYRTYLKERIREDAVFVKQLTHLKDKILVCFCKPNPCHGDVLAKYVDTGII